MIYKEPHNIKFIIGNRVDNLRKMKTSLLFLFLPKKWKSYINICINDLEEIKEAL